MAKVGGMLAVLLAALLAAAGGRTAEDAGEEAQWIVVTAPAFRGEIEPLRQHRLSQGMSVVVVSTTDVLSEEEVRSGRAEPLEAKLKDLSLAWEGPTYVLLVGAPTSDGVDDPQQRVVPALKGKVKRMAGQPTDNAFGCPGGGLMPSVAVGRFPARTPEEARGMVQKTLAWEKENRPGQWKRRITLLAGAPSYNATVDALIERMAISQLGALGPQWSGRAIYDNPASPFALPGNQLRDQALSYLREGQLFIVYLGHSSASGFWGRMRREDWAAVSIPQGNGVFATFGCYGCQLTGAEGYGVHAMRNPHGPVAVMGAHGETSAAMSKLMAEGLLEGLRGGKVPARLGTVWLGMKSRLAVGPMNPLVFRVLDEVDGDPQTPQAIQRLEHLEMFVLLGDPALRLPDGPVEFPLAVEGEVRPGATITVSGMLPQALVGSRGRLTVERSMTSLPTDLEPLPPPGRGAERRERMTANHRRANRFVLAEMEIDAAQGGFEAQVKLPDALPWRSVILRACLSTDATDAMAVHVLEVKPIRQAPPTAGVGRRAALAAAPIDSGRCSCIIHVRGEGG